MWGDVTLAVEGTGLVTLQLDVSYNVEFPDIQREPLNPENPLEIYPSFDLECTPTFWGRNNSHMRMSVCGSWTGNHVSGHFSVHSIWLSRWMSFNQGV